MITAILDTLKQRAVTRLRTLRTMSRELHPWTRPLTQTLVGGALTDGLKTKRAVMAENALLRQQLIVLRRHVKRPALTPRDRVQLVLLARLAHTWHSALLIVQPQTLLHWHRQGYRFLWRTRSAAVRKRPQIAPQTVALIQQRARENRLWGAERIRGELLKLGLRVGKRTVQRYRRGVRPPRPSGQTWATFLSTHAHAIWACDFLPVIDVGFRTLYAFFLVELGSRRVVHVSVTRHPTDAWVAQQLREATPFRTRPRFLIRDHDSTFGAPFARVAAASGIEILCPPIAAPRERDRRTLPGQRAPGLPGSRPDPIRAPPPAGAPHLQRLLQCGAAAPGSGASPPGTCGCREHSIDSRHACSRHPSAGRPAS